MPPGAVTDALGQHHVLNEIPGRIVSLTPAVTEILFAIGAGDKLVGVTQYCNYPPAARNKTSVGSFSGATVSVEMIRSLDPDLVFLSADMHGRIVSLLNDLGITSFAVEPRNFSQVYDVIEMVGKITGRADAAEEVVKQMQKRIAAVQQRIHGRQRPEVFWLLSETPLMTAGSDTFVSQAIDLGGGRNIFGDVRGQWPLVSPEQILFRRPEWILLGDDMGINADMLQGHPFWQSLPAVREGRLVIVGADILYRYGPRLAEGVELIAEILHGP